jgi:hypothetical protein
MQAGISVVREVTKSGLDVDSITYGGPTTSRFRHTKAITKKEKVLDKDSQ